MLKAIYFFFVAFVACVGRGIVKRRKSKAQLDQEAEFNQVFCGMRQAIRRCAPQEIGIYDQSVTEMWYIYRDLPDTILRPRIDELRTEISNRRNIAAYELNN